MADTLLVLSNTQNLLKVVQGFELCILLEEDPSSEPVREESLDLVAHKP